MKRMIRAFCWGLLRVVPLLRPVYLTRHTQTPVPLLSLLRFKAGWRRDLYWPVHAASVVVDARRIHIGIETSPGLMPGCYIQGTNGVVLGDYTQIAAGVAIISANHELTDNRKHVSSPPVVIGSHSWIGANAVILPGVKLGPYTVVGAGAIVTKSFDAGYQVLAGNPARLVRALNPKDCILHRSANEFHGYIPAAEFSRYRSQHLDPLS